VISRFFTGDGVRFVGGLGGVGVGIGAIGFILITGFIVEHFHFYTPILAVAALLSVLRTVACSCSADRSAG
jgi:MFS family permease